jgi:hypothetical protein
VVLSVSVGTRKIPQSLVHTGDWNCRAVGGRSISRRAGVQPRHQWARMERSEARPMLLGLRHRPEGIQDRWGRQQKGAAQHADEAQHETVWCLLVACGDSWVGGWQRWQRWQWRGAVAWGEAILSSASKTLRSALPGKSPDHLNTIGRIQALLQHPQPQPPNSSSVTPSSLFALPFLSRAALSCCCRASLSPSTHVDIFPTLTPSSPTRLAHNLSHATSTKPAEPRTPIIPPLLAA